VLADDVHAVHLLLAGGTGGVPGGGTGVAAEPGAGVVSGAEASRSLALAIDEGAGLAVAEALLEAGADPDTIQADGRSSIRVAVRRGRADYVRALLRHGGRDDATPADRFIGACTHADRAAAGHILDRHPLLRDGLTDDDRAAIVDAAGHAGAHAVDVMLEFGFALNVQRLGDGATPVHAAAYAGRANLVRRLAERGADIDAPDGGGGLTPLRWALAGSIDRPAHSPDGDWRATVQALVDAGATIDDIEVPPEPADVAGVLIAHGAGDPSRRRASASNASQADVAT
jgi:ankyrin repeat protein